MSQRILTLIYYFLRSLIFSLAGLLYLLLGLAYYWILFNPRQQTPDVAYYILVLGILGIILSFLVTLSIAARANKAIHFPIMVRLNSRIEYLVAVFFAALFFASLVQALYAFFALVLNGPTLSIQNVIEILPIWVSGNILFVILALHASDLVSVGWSRIAVFGSLGVILYLPNIIQPLSTFFSDLINRLGNAFLTRGFSGLASFFFDLGGWINTTFSTVLEQIFSILLWPFRGISQALINGGFSPIQAIAPAILLLYAAILFILAADFFASKDLNLTE